MIIITIKKHKQLKPVLNSKTNRFCLILYDKVHLMTDNPKTNTRIRSWVTPHFHCMKDKLEGRQKLQTLTALCYCRVFFQIFEGP